MKRALHCDNSKAKLFASIVDREGRHCIKEHNKAECEKVKDKVVSSIDRASIALPRKKKIHALVVNVHLFNMQVISHRLLQWMVNAVAKLGYFSENDSFMFTE